MNSSIDKINKFIDKTFLSLTLNKEVFLIKLKYKEYKVILSSLTNNYFLIICSTAEGYYGSTIYQKDMINLIDNNYSASLSSNNLFNDIINLIYNLKSK